MKKIDSGKLKDSTSDAAHTPKGITTSEPGKTCFGLMCDASEQAQAIKYKKIETLKWIL